MCRVSSTQKCLKKIESMCSAFLWSGSPNDSSKSKVAWEDVCKPKDEGGLGIRKLRVFYLHLIWRLFSSSGSLWVAWINIYLLKQVSFWDVKRGSKGSWIWRKILKLRSIAATFLKSEIGNGLSTSFWFDTWNNLGCLFDIWGITGPQQLGVPRNATVAAASATRGWKIRSRQHTRYHATL